MAIRSEPQTPANLKPGLRLHGFTLVQKLGNGGFGEAWLAENLDRERFALKIPVGLDPKGLDSLQREAELFRKLRGNMASGERPPIVYLKHDFLDGDPPALAMEFIAGGDLRAYMKQRGGNPLSYPETLPIIRDILAALDFAHAQGVIHRDLSPENVLYDPGEKRWKVADFGLGFARTDAGGVSFAASMADSDGAAADESMAIAGKLHYMAPEQRMEGVSAGPRADLYALGVIWAQLLTGILDSGVPPLWQDEAPVKAQRFISKCLKREPTQRWDSAGALLLAIESEEGARPGMAPAAAMGAGAASAQLGPSRTEQGPPRRPDYLPEPTPEEDYSEGGGWIAKLVIGGVFVGALCLVGYSSHSIYRHFYPSYRYTRNPNSCAGSISHDAKLEDYGADSRVGAEKIRDRLMRYDDPPAPRWTPRPTPRRTPEPAPKWTPRPTPVRVASVSRTPAPDHGYRQPVRTSDRDIGGPRIDLPRGLSIHLAEIAPGTFEMGSPASEEGRGDDETRRSVRLGQAFHIGVTEITQAQWNAVMGDDPSRFKDADASRFQGPDLPAHSVSWVEAKQFCEILSAGTPGWKFDLPTEEEWEYACRAGSDTPFSFGRTISERQANYNASETYGGSPAGAASAGPVAAGSLPANRWGLFEAHGNVWEWCRDLDGSKRIRRGGSWVSYPKALRSAERRSKPASYQGNDTGFRVVAYRQ